jgi:hypothetical protein
VELLEEMPQPTQVLLLSKIEWEHFFCLASIIQSPKLVSFPSFCHPPISSYLVSPSQRFQILNENPNSFFKKISDFNAGMFSFE